MRLSAFAICPREIQVLLEAVPEEKRDTLSTIKCLPPPVSQLLPSLISHCHPPCMPLAKPVCYLLTNTPRTFLPQKLCSDSPDLEGRRSLSIILLQAWVKAPLLPKASLLCSGPL